MWLQFCQFIPKPAIDGLVTSLDTSPCEKPSRYFAFCSGFCDPNTSTEFWIDAASFALSSFRWHQIRHCRQPEPLFQQPLIPWRQHSPFLPDCVLKGFAQSMATIHPIFQTRQHAREYAVSVDRIQSNHTHSHQGYGSQPTTWKATPKTSHVHDLLVATCLYLRRHG